MRAVVLLGEPGFTIEIHAQSRAERKMLEMLKAVENPTVTVQFRQSDQPPYAYRHDEGADIMDVGFRAEEKKT